jgi:hypothetical protein
MVFLAMREVAMVFLAMVFLAMVFLAMGKVAVGAEGGARDGLIVMLCHRGTPQLAGE